MSAAAKWNAAEDGAAGWEKLQAKRYQLLVTDNAMPKMSGVELLRQLWASGKALPSIMATGRPPEEQLTDPPTAILLKPYTIEQLIGTVRKVLPLPTVSVCSLHHCQTHKSRWPP